MAHWAGQAHSEQKTNQRLNKNQDKIATAQLLGLECYI